MGRPVLFAEPAHLASVAFIVLCFVKRMCPYLKYNLSAAYFTSCRNSSFNRLYLLQSTLLNGHDFLVYFTETATSYCVFRGWNHFTHLITMHEHTLTNAYIDVDYSMHTKIVGWQLTEN